MGGELFKEMTRGAAGEFEKNDRWLVCESAIVADINDPDRQHRIKVIIPSIDEDNVFDDWVRPLTPSAMGDGHGSVFLPPVGSEVFVTGMLGQKYNLVYLGAVYNEETRKPEELNADTPGIKVPKNFSLLVGLLLKMQAQNIEIIASALAKVTGQNVEVIAAQIAKVTADNIQLVADGQMQLNGNTIVMNSDGSITIHGSGNVAVSADGTLSLEGRTVNKVGPAI